MSYDCLRQWSRKSRMIKRNNELKEDRMKERKEEKGRISEKEIEEPENVRKKKKEEKGNKLTYHMKITN